MPTASKPLGRFVRKKNSVNLRSRKAILLRCHIVGVQSPLGGHRYICLHADLTNALKKWLNLVLGAIVTIINCMLVTIAVINRESTSSGILAVALVQATSLVQTLNQTIVNAADVSKCRT